MKVPLSLTIVLAVLATAFAPLSAGSGPGRGFLFYNGEIVRTVVPPAAMKKVGTDNLYAVMEGVVDQLPVAAVAPGDQGYHGGKWAFHAVTWNVPAYLLTSESDVLAAEDAGDVSITRVAELDFKCPIQP